MKRLFDFNCCLKPRKKLLNESTICLQRKKLLWDLGIEFTKRGIQDQI